MTAAILAAALLALVNAAFVWLWLDHIACEHYAREWDAHRQETSPEWLASLRDLPLLDEAELVAAQADPEFSLADIEWGAS